MIIWEAIHSKSHQRKIKYFNMKKEMGLGNGKSFYPPPLFTLPLDDWCQNKIITCNGVSKEFSFF